MSLNENLNRAAAAKEDEFYTQLSDIEKELRHYRSMFEGKVVYCNCDDPRESAFFHYFSYNFNFLKLKKLITTCYKNNSRDLFTNNDNEKAIYLEYNGMSDGDTVPNPNDIGIHYLKEDGDFRSQECIDLLKSVDIVVTNPPFSLLVEYVQQLITYNKKFLIVGTINKATTKDIFAFIKSNQLWLGYNSGDMEFRVPDYYKPKKTRYRQDSDGVKWRSMGNICWFTNLPVSKRSEEIVSVKHYNPNEYPKYDNYNAIDVSKVNDIPIDFDGKMGVPITFLTRHNPNQFEIIGIDRYTEDNPMYGKRFTINGNEKYARIIIKRIV